MRCREQADPVYEAKGIETVRRDGCPAVAKILEKCLRSDRTSKLDLNITIGLWPKRHQFINFIVGLCAISNPMQNIKCD